MSLARFQIPDPDNVVRHVANEEDGQYGERRNAMCHSQPDRHWARTICYDDAIIFAQGESDESSP
jgi:hypothetical protein